MAKDKRDCGCGPKPAYRPETASVGGSSGQTIAFRDGLPAIPDHMLSDSAPLPQHQTGRALGHIFAALESAARQAQYSTSSSDDAIERMASWRGDALVSPKVQPDRALLRKTYVLPEDKKAQIRSRLMALGVGPRR